MPDRPAALTAADILTVGTLLDARLSPDGELAVYSVATVDETGTADVAQLLVADLAERTTEPITTAEHLNVLPSWCADGEAVIFVSTRAGTPQLCRCDVATRTATQLTTLPRGVAFTAPAVSPGQKRVAFCAAVGPPRDPTAPHRVTQGLWRIDGMGLVADSICEVHLIDADGGTPEQITDDGAILMELAWAPSGDRLLYVGLALGETPSYFIRVVDVTTKSTTTVWDGEFWLYPPTAAWLPDGRIVRTRTNKMGMGEPVELVVGEATPGAEEDCRTQPLSGWPFGIIQGDFPFLRFQTPRLVVSHEGDEVYIAVQRGGSTEIVAIRVGGEPECRTVFAGEHCAVPFDASSNHVLVGMTTLHDPPDLWLVDRSSSRPERVTRLNAARFGPDRYFDVEHLDVLGIDGQPVESWFLAPKGATRPVPTIVEIHGGPHAAWGHLFSFDDCMLAAAGYGVLRVNQRGSIGYSPRFATELHGDWGHHDVGDVLAGIDAAVLAGWADGAALAVTGVSAGAYLAMWLGTHDERFSAVVAESPCLDWMTMFGADVGWVFPQWLFAEPGQGVHSADRIAGWSPTWHSSSCHTPTLLIQHEQDLRTPPANSDTMFALLKLHGCDVEMLRMPVTGHAGSMELGSPRTRVAQNEALLDWFERHLPTASSEP